MTVEVEGYSKFVGIVGSRRRNSNGDYSQLVNCLEANELLNPEEVMFISGGCSEGADNFAEEIAKKNGIPILIFYPDYNRNGRSAPILRNTLISAHCEVLIAMVHPDRKGGTEDTLKKAVRLGKKTHTLERP